MDIIQKLVIKILGDVEGLEKALYHAQKEIKSFDKVIDGVSKTFIGVGKSATKYVTLPIVAAVGAVAGLGIVCVKMAADLEQSMRNVGTVMDLSGDKFADYTDQVLELSKTMPQSAKNLAEGLYDIAGSGFVGAEAMKVLEATARAASAGVTTTEVATRGVVAVLNSFALGADDVDEVVDAMFATVDKGVITFEELAGTIGSVVSTAKIANIDLNELSGFIAYLTVKGIGAAEATTILARQITTIINPSEKLAELLAKNGYESGELALKQIGLLGVMGLVNEEAGDSVTKMQELFPEVRAMRGAAAELGAGFGTLTEFMGQFEDVTGSADKALEEQSKGFKFQMQVLKNNVAAAGIEIGNKFLPALTGLAEAMKTTLIPALNKLADYFEPIIARGVELIPVVADLATKYIPKIVDKIGEWVDWFMKLEPRWKKIILAAVGFAAAFGPVMIIIGKLIPAFKLLGAVISWILHPAAALVTIGKVLAGVIAFITSPITLTIAAIAALIAIGYLVWKNWDTIKAKAIEIWGAISEFFGNLWEKIKQTFQNALDWVEDYLGAFTPLGFVIANFESLSEYFSYLWEIIKQTFQNAWDWIKNLFYEYTPLGIIIANWDEIVAWFGEMWERVKEVFKEKGEAIWQWMLDWIPFLNIIVENWDEIVAILKEGWNKILGYFIEKGTAIKDFFVEKFNIMRDFAINIWTTVSNFFKKIWDTIYGFFKSKIDAIRNYVTSRFTTIKTETINIWNSIKNFFINIWKSIKSSFTIALNFIKNLISTVFNFMKNSVVMPIWNSIKNFFSGIWNSIISRLNSFKSSFLNVWNRIKDGLKSPINAMIGLINSLLSRIQSGINRMISALNRIGFKVPDWLGEIIPGLAGREFGISVSKISIPNIPKLQLGGYIREAGFVDVGERGRERIFLPKGAEVRPLEKISPGLAKQEIHIHSEYNEELASKTFARLFAQYVGVINK